eukprot:s1476_g2.t1
MEVKPAAETAEAEQFYSNLEAGAVNVLSFVVEVTVPLLQDSVLRVILPPGFTLQQFDYFEGVSRHFAKNPAASAVMKSRSNLTAFFGSSAPEGMVEVLMLRVLVDSLVDELLEFRITVRNPMEELPEMYQDLNRWLVETLDATSGLVVNSNKLACRGLPWRQMTRTCLTKRRSWGLRKWRHSHIARTRWRLLFAAVQLNRHRRPCRQWLYSARLDSTGRGSRSGQREEDYLPAFGFLATSSVDWSPKHLARVKLEAQPMLEIVVRGHEELFMSWAHTPGTCSTVPFGAACTDSLMFSRFSMGWGRPGSLVLCWLDSAGIAARAHVCLHDPVKEGGDRIAFCDLATLRGVLLRTTTRSDECTQEILGSSYESFSSTPFAGIGGRSGTTARLRSWCQTLCRCINDAQAPPLAVSVTLQLLAAPTKDVAMIALARTCAEDIYSSLAS